MNDSGTPIKRRPKRKGNDSDVQIHARVDKQLLDAAMRPNCSVSYILNRALKACIEKEHPNNLKALALRIRSVKLDIGRLNQELSELREQAKILGVSDLDEFESNYMGDC